MSWSSFEPALSVCFEVVWETRYLNMCVFFRLLSGRTCYVLWVCLSTSHWMPSTGSRLDAPIAALRWASCLTTAVTPSPPVSFCFCFSCLTSFRCVPVNLKLLTGVLVFVSAVFVVLGTSIAVQMGTNPDWMFFCCFAGMFMFYCAHWQTYVSGTLRFGMWVNKSCLFFLFCCLKVVFFVCFLNKKIIYNNLSINNAQELEFSP